MNRLITDGLNITHVSDKGLVTKLYKECLQISKKNRKILILRSGTEHEQT